jgi:hypothetical protein
VRSRCGTFNLNFRDLAGIYEANQVLQLGNTYLFSRIFMLAISQERHIIYMLSVAIHQLKLQDKIG